MKLLFFKLTCTAVVVFGLAYPFLYPADNAGILTTVNSIGVFGTIVITTAFLSAVGLYCYDLQRTLELVRSEARTAAPKSVWYMFLLPYNFVEDFFIVYNVSKSLKSEATKNPNLSSVKKFGFISGLGWCTAQIVSLLPNRVGEAAGMMALIFWIVHWNFIRRMIQLLTKAI